MSSEPILIAPAISVLTELLRNRPRWEEGKPLKAPAALYEAAIDEMCALMKKRGYKLPVSLSHLRNGQENFLLFGTPIISE